MQERHLCWPSTFSWPRIAPHFFILESPLMNPWAHSGYAYALRCNPSQHIRHKRVCFDNLHERFRLV